MLPDVNIAGFYASSTPTANATVAVWLPAVYWIVGSVIAFIVLAGIINLIGWIISEIILKINFLSWEKKEGRHWQGSASSRYGASLHPYGQGLEYKGILRTNNGSVYSGRRDTLN